MITALAFLVALGVLITVHEYGHYRVALACGVKVLRFSLGFGPVLWRYQRSPDSTEFVLSALPLGGYVRMLDEREGPVRPEERDRAFNRKPLWQRSAVVAAGPLANLVLALVLFTGLHWGGVEEAKARLNGPVARSLAEAAGLRSGDWVQAVSFDGQQWDDVRAMSDLRWSVTQAVLGQLPLHLRVVDRQGHAARELLLPLDTLPSKDMNAEVLRRIGLGGAFSEPRLSAVAPDGPAARAGLQPGDLVLQVDGAQIGDSDQLLERIRSHLDITVPMAWLVERGGRRLEISVIPTVIEEGGQRIGRVGVAPGQRPEMLTVSYGFGEGMVRAVSRTWEISALTLKMLGRMLIGEASLKNISGPWTMADYAGQSARLGLGQFVGYLALLSISIGVLNLLPLPVLDGGHLMYYLFEALTGHPPSDIWLERLQRGGIVIMLLVMSLAFYNDAAPYLGRH